MLELLRESINYFFLLNEFTILYAKYIADSFF